MYTEYAGCAVTAGIPVNDPLASNAPLKCTAHGRSRPEVGSAKCIDVYGRGGVSWQSCILDTSVKKSTPSTTFLRPTQNFFLLTVCRLNQYLLHGSEK